MKIKYNFNKNIDPQKILNLYKSVGWVNKNSGIKVGKSISLAYENSQIVISAWIDKELIGIIRALTDKKVNGVIFGLLVDKKFQKKGVGKELLYKCMNKYPKIRWYLWAGNSKAEGFYKKVGMRIKKQILFEKLPNKS